MEKNQTSIFSFFLFFGIIKDENKEKNDIQENQPQLIDVKINSTKRKAQSSKSFKSTKANNNQPKKKDQDIFPIQYEILFSISHLYSSKIMKINEKIMKNLQKNACPKF